MDYAKYAKLSWISSSHLRMMKMFDKKKDPYEYVNENNFDMVRECLMQGLHSKDPKTIVEHMARVTDIPYEAIQAIVSHEIGGAFDQHVKKGDSI